MSASLTRSVANLRTVTRGFASSARAYAEASPSAPAPTPRPRPNNSSSQRPSQSGGKSTLSDRLRGEQKKSNGSRPSRTGQGSNKSGGGGGGERRGKRLPSVFDTASGSGPGRSARGGSIKNLDRDLRKMPAPVPTTDWNSPLFSKPGYERLLTTAPRPSSIFVPDLTAAAPSMPASGGKSKGKSGAPAAKVANAKLNLPGIKTAVNALKLHLRPGGRHVLGPLNHPTAVAFGALSQNRLTLTRSSKGSDDKSSAADLKESRIALQNEQVGGSYERYSPEAVLKAAGVEGQAKGVQGQAVKDAAQALTLNADVAPEGKSFVAKTIAERIST